jgi:hypothetical protein
VLAGLLHAKQRRVIEADLIDVAPVKSRRIHRETGCKRASGTNHDIVLSSSFASLSVFGLFQNRVPFEGTW